MLNQLYVFLCIIAGIWAVVEFIRKGDEIPVFLILFTYMTISRLFLLESGEAQWVSFDYGIDFVFNMEYAYIVSDLIMLGTWIFVLTYLLIPKKEKERKRGDNALFAEFVTSQKKHIILGFIVFFLFSLVMQGSLSMGYGFLLRLANSSFIILLFLYARNAKTSGFQKFLFALFMCFLAYTTYSPGLRFQFLGWSIPIFLYLTKDLGIVKKIVLYVVGGFTILVFFSMAGALRNPENIGKPLSELYQDGKERLFDTEDINFIDGFIMLYQVYPDQLDYHYGADHLGILLRPVPRSWWPGKPRGGWHQKYADKYNDGEEFGTGISTTIYGVFFGEGGSGGIVIFSIAWGLMLAGLVRYGQNYDSDIQVLFKGMVLAALIPIMRSGDLAGDIAIVGMSYWPVFIFIYRYNTFLKNKESEQPKKYEKQVSFS